MGMVIRGVCDSSVCVRVRAIKEKRLESSTSNSVHVYGRTSACIDPEVKRLKIKVTEL